jgi:hypothetical protein
MLLLVLIKTFFINFKLFKNFRNLIIIYLALIRLKMFIVEFLHNLLLAYIIHYLTNKKEIR